MPHGGKRVCRRQGCTRKIVDCTDGAGFLISKCQGCERHRRGLCIECPAKLNAKHPRRLRCDDCHYVHRRDTENRSARQLYAEAPRTKNRACQKYRKKNRKRLATYAKQKRDEERAKGPPTPIDRLYWREKTRRNRATRSPELHAHEMNRKRDKRAAAKRQPLEVAA